MIHFPLLLLLVLCLDGAGVPRIAMWNHAGFLAFVGVTFVLSHLVYRHYEWPMQQLIRRSFLGAERQTSHIHVNPAQNLEQQKVNQA